MLAALVWGCAAPVSPCGTGLAPVDLLGTWTYEGDQSAPPATLSGTLTITSQSGQDFTGTLDVTQTDGSGPHPLSGPVTGCALDATSVGLVLQLTLSSTTTTLAGPALSDYDAGFVANQGPTAVVSSNRAWRLQLSAAAPTWTATSTQPGVAARPNKPAADLQWSTAAGGPFTALTTPPVSAVCC